MKTQAALALAALTALATPVAAAGRGEGLAQPQSRTQSQSGIGNAYRTENRAKLPEKDTQSCIRLYDNDPSGEVFCFNVNGEDWRTRTKPGR